MIIKSGTLTMDTLLLQSWGGTLSDHQDFVQQLLTTDHKVFESQKATGTANYFLIYSDKLTVQATYADVS